MKHNHTHQNHAYASTIINNRSQPYCKQQKTARTVLIITDITINVIINLMIRINICIIICIIISIATIITIIIETSA